VGVNVCVADTDAEARRAFTTVQQSFLNLIRGKPGQLPAPVNSMDGRWNPAEQAQVDRMTAISLVGSPQTARQQLAALIELTHADEIICTAQLFDHTARVRSFELVAEVVEQFNRGRATASVEPAEMSSR
jgi:alkanesulfonate monooxygenase SsuD/methylene tetrahydromethanopterin reductase-like flavin-dependent oxidoreductase (luciferase family)